METSFNDANEALKNEVQEKKVRVGFFFPIKSFILLQLLVAAVVANQGNPRCEDHYKSKGIFNSESKLNSKLKNQSKSESNSESKSEVSVDMSLDSLIDRLNHLLEENPYATPILLMNNFLESELAKVTSEYQAQVELFSRVGVNSKLQSTAKVLEATMGTAERLLSELEEIAESEISIQESNESKTGWRRIFRRKSKFEKESEGDLQNKLLNEKINSFKSCKTGVDKCSLELRKAIDEAGENLVKIDFLIQKLKDFSLTLEELKNSIHKTKVSNHEDDLFLKQIIQQRIDLIENKIKNMKTASQLEKTKLITALATINSILPQFEERILIMLAKFADKEAVKDWEKVIPEKNEGSYSSLMMKNIIGAGSDYAKFEIIRSLSVGAAEKNTKIFDSSEALRILQSISAENSYANKVIVQISFFENISFKSDPMFKQAPTYSGDMPLLPMIVYLLGKITKPNADEPSSNSSFYSKAVELAFYAPEFTYRVINSSFNNRHTAKYVELLTGLIHRTLMPFIPGNN